jgi:ABC-2 type transport system ATP-binding protein
VFPDGHESWEKVPPMPNDLLAAGAGGAAVLPPGVLAFVARAMPRLPSALLLALVPLLVLVVALDIYCLIDLARARYVRNVPKFVWVIVIVFVSAPIGALLYLFIGRDRGGEGAAGREAGLGHDAPAGAGGAGGEAGADGPGDGHRVAVEHPPRGDQAPQSHAPHGQALAAPAPEGSPIVTTSGLTRDYGGTGLFDVDLAVPRGSIYGLVGPNGAGKTTLLSLLSAIRRPDRGTISTRIGRHQIAVCPDVPEFDGWLTAAEVVDLARSLVAPAAGGQAVAAALTTAGLAGSAGRRVAGFSRGMVQRLGLACALVGEPELLILDEPTSALDPAGRAEILGLVTAMRGHRTVIFSSHILADVQRIADQVGILRSGRLLYQGATKDLIDTYLKPSWLVRIAADPRPVAAALAVEPWVTRVEPAGTDTLRVDASSIEAGERGIPAVIAGCGARQVSCEPVAADLESAFLALTGASS